MWFWWFMLFCDLLIPLAMVIGGGLMLKHTPKSINGVIGYRTRRSMKNSDTWKFAHEYCGRLWHKLGWITLVTSAVIHIPFIYSSENTIGILSIALCAAQLAVLIASVFITENALKKSFTDEGKRK